MGMFDFSMPNPFESSSPRKKTKPKAKSIAKKKKAPAQPRKTATPPTRVRPKKIVRLMGRWESNSGLNEVGWSTTGNLNAMHETKFKRQDEAIRAAKKKAISMGEGTELMMDIPGMAYDKWVVVGGKLKKV